MRILHAPLLLACALHLGCGGDDDGGSSSDDTGVADDTALADSGSKADSAKSDTTTSEDGGGDTPVTEKDAGTDTTSADVGTDTTPADAGTDTTVTDAGTDTTSTDAGTDTTPADSGDAGTASFTLTVQNYLSWCTVSVNGGATSTALTQTLTVPSGTVVPLHADKASATFIWSYWVGTAGDTSSTHDTAMSTTVTMTANKTVQACCPDAPPVPYVACPPPT